MKQNYLMLLWHMHQPFYKDLAQDQYVMPWVRLHALKDYYGMVAMLEEFPSVHVTFNMVPSLVAQIEDYANESANEKAYTLTFKPVELMTSGDREDLLASAFQINRNLLDRYPRFRELDERVRQAGMRSTAAAQMSNQEIRDLQVISQLAWFDEIYLAQDVEIKGLVAKQRGFSEADKQLVRSKEVEIFKATLEVCRHATDGDQIEISTSPFYHPILPLLCDTRVALESHPGFPQPKYVFRHPEDARDQLRAAIQLHERVFGKRPKGLWPSEGSVSNEVLHLAASEGFRWVATDEGVLGRSRQIGFYRHPDGTVSSGNELYRPHRFKSGDLGIHIYFRDHELSDLIGFVYSRLDPAAAAADLHNRIRAVARSTGDQPAVVSIILDGENCWEFYSGNGREFLRQFYGRIAADSELRAVTASEAISVVEPGTLTHVVPGSWINSNFDVWIGAEEDNKAWDLLSGARDFFASRAHTRDGLSLSQIETAAQELWIAEGSDWNWWYGPEHSSDQDEEFDVLYRIHLSNIYRLLGGEPPDDLAVPLKRPRGQAQNIPPMTAIAPVIDGRITNYFEWMGAGIYSPDSRSGSMHGSTHHVEALYYGSGDNGLNFRLDLSPSFVELHSEYEIRASVNCEPRTRLNVSVKDGQLVDVEFWRADRKVRVPEKLGSQLKVATGRIFETHLDYALLGTCADNIIRFQVSLWVNKLPLQLVPQEGWISFAPALEVLGW